MTETARDRWKVRAIGFAWAWAMRIGAATWRRDVLGSERVDALERAGARVLLVVWHGCYRALLAAVRDRPSVVVSTDSFRGHIIEAAATRLGHRCVLRPEGLRGDAALGWLARALGDATRIVLVADGPSGPARRTKRGVVQLAARLQLRVIPCATASSWFYARERWDAQEISLPFARVAVVFGEGLPLPPPILAETELAAWRERVSRAIDDCHRQALAHARGGRELALRSAHDERSSL